MKYSVITPVYNRADCILRCLESVGRNVENSMFDMEHIIVDDGSTDDTPNIVRKYEAEHHHVVFIQFPQNRGTNAARNAAIAIARGRYCIILDSDDYFIDSALSLIDSEVVNHPEIGHFCFAPDDMQESYSRNPILSKRNQVIISFEDFLLGRVSGDFTHVIATDTLRKYPFDEDLKIYEGVFFLSFYKEVKNILFTNEVTTIRERSRVDSVTRDVIRTNTAVVEKHIRAKEILIDRFHEDYTTTSGGREVLWWHLTLLLENYLLIGNYIKAKEVMSRIEKIQVSPVPIRLKAIYNLRLGKCCFLCLRFFLFMKYQVLLKPFATFGTCKHI